MPAPDPVLKAASPDEIERALGRSLLLVSGPGDAAALRRTLASLRVAAELVVVLGETGQESHAQPCREAGLELVVLDGARTWPERCNLGLDLARRRGRDTLLLVETGTRFVSDVVRDLLGAALADPALGAVAPARLESDAGGGTRRLRDGWDLSRVAFGPDRRPPPEGALRLDADYGAGPCLLLRVAALDRTGPADPAFRLLAQADLGFRLRQAGYGSAVLPEAVVECESAPAPDESGAALAQDRDRFAVKHLGYGVQLSSGQERAPRLRAGRSDALASWIGRHGLLDPNRPVLDRGAPRPDGGRYLLLGRDMVAVRPEDVTLVGAYRAVLAPSRWHAGLLGDAAACRPALVPPGLDTDVFHPWAAPRRLYDEPTFLWLGAEALSADLAAMLAAWQLHLRQHPGSRLLALGPGVFAAAGLGRSGGRDWHGLTLLDDPDRRVTFAEPRRALAAEDLAGLYRGVDALVCPGSTGAFRLSLAECMACGTPAVGPAYGGSQDLFAPGMLGLQGHPADAPGAMPRPDSDDIADAMGRALGPDRQAARAAGLRQVWGGFTWRHTAFALRAALVPLQERTDLRADQYGHRAAGSEDIFDRALDLERAEGPRPPRRGRATGRVAGFDPDHYRTRYPDIAAAGADPHRHYVEHGWREERSPAPDLTTRHLVEQNPEARRLLLEGAYRGPPRRRFGLRIGTRRPDGPTLPPLADGVRRKSGVLFGGYLEAGLGLGESGRTLARAMIEAGVPLALYPYNRRVRNRHVGRFMEERYDLSARFDVTVLYLSLEQLPEALRELGPRQEGSYVILRPYWELERFPEAWRANFAGVDEVWAPTAFVAEAVRDAFAGPVTLIPPAVDAAAPAPVRRAHFGLPDGPFLFLFSFDYNSAASRKNPLGAVEAFRAAFPDPREPVGLVLKSTGAPGMWPRLRGEIAAAAAADPRIRVIDGMLPRGELVALLALCDSYLSLHRSEGFGLGMVESMMLGKPVIGTDYSGSRDFLSAERGYPVAFRLRPLRDGEYPSGEGQSWAEPDLDAAVAALREVFRDPVGRWRRAEAARRFVQDRFGLDNVGRLARARLDAIQA
ncbi:glycosyltransferase, partial [Enterovirga sp.]|uniref:glycosyltransferase n=1 Tax=Enterovirga sp. TaxID=2026350 RepID=UPI0026196299